MKRDEAGLDERGLLPCPNPWCESHQYGGGGPTVPDDLLDMSGSNGLRIGCAYCPIMGPVCSTQAGAIAAWNTRNALSGQQPADVAEIARIVSLLRWCLEIGDKRTAVENCDALIGLLETGASPHDVPSARELAKTITERVAATKPGGALVRPMGTPLATTPPPVPDRQGDVAGLARLIREEARFPSGQPRMSEATALKIAERALQSRPGYEEGVRAEALADKLLSEIALTYRQSGGAYVDPATRRRFIALLNTPLTGADALEGLTWGEAKQRVGVSKRERDDER